MRAERLTRKFGHSKSLAFYILVEKYKKGSLRFGRKVKFRLLNPALRIAKTLACIGEMTRINGEILVECLKFIQDNEGKVERYAFDK